MILAAVAVVAGLAVLVKGADVFVRGASDGARLLRVPPLLVGMVVVGFGTSAPELTVSVISAWRGSPELALGNAYGSNTCNVALILGLCALVRPLAVKRAAWTFDLPALLVVTAVSWMLVALVGAKPSITRLESGIFLSMFLVALWWSAKRQTATAVVGDDDPAKASEHGGRAGLAAAARVVGGLAALVLSSRALVWGAVEIARALGVSELVIGLTIVAVGTSLPELASSLAAARRGEDDLAVGNIIGSNLFNTLAVVGLAGMVRPMPEVDPYVAWRDIPASAVAAALLMAFGHPRGGGDGRLGRVPGALFLVLYIGYLALLVAGGAVK